VTGVQTCALPISAGLDILFNATSLKLEQVADPVEAAKAQVDVGLVFTPQGVDEYYDPTRQSAQITDIRIQTVVSRYDAAKIAATLQERGVDPSVLNPLPVTQHPLTSPEQAAQNAFLSFFLPSMLITMTLTEGLSVPPHTSAFDR